MDGWDLRYCIMASCSTTSYHARKKKVSNYAKTVETYVANTDSS